MCTIYWHHGQGVLHLIATNMWAGGDGDHGDGGPPPRLVPVLLPAGHDQIQGMTEFKILILKREGQQVLFMVGTLTLAT